MPCVPRWECVLAVPRLDKGWREEVRKNLGLTKGLGAAFWKQLPLNVLGCHREFVALSFFAVQILLPYAEKL